MEWETSSSELSFELSELPLFSRLRLLLDSNFAARCPAHRGGGCNRSNCSRSRLVYSAPLIMSSVPVVRNFRSREFPAREMVIRSSSLSTHAAE